MLYFVALYLAPLPSDAPVAPQRAMLTPESKKGLAFLLDPLIYWLPVVDSFRNELLSFDSDTFGFLAAQMGVLHCAELNV
jgi:hypothetical protein